MEEGGRVGPVRHFRKPGGCLPQKAKIIRGSQICARERGPGAQAYPVSTATKMATAATANKIMAGFQTKRNHWS